MAMAAIPFRPYTGVIDTSSKRYQAAKAIAVGCCNITLADLASPELVTDEAFHLITGALLMAKYGDAILNLEKGVNET